MAETRPNSKYDLHLHTCWSYDATAEPEEHFRRARVLGVRCLAITEHHHLDSLGEVLALAVDYPEIRVIPAAELTVTCSIGAVDLLCYGFPVPLPEVLEPVIAAYHEWQREYGAAVSRGMVALGYDYGDDRRLELLQTYRAARTLAVQGTTHVQNGAQRNHFLAQGWIADADEYSSLLRRARESAPTPPYPSAELVVPAVKETGALIAIAHPPVYFQGADEGRMDTLRRELHLDGIECAHPGVPEDLTPTYRQYCVKHKLFSCAGSDAHSADDIEAKLSRHGGQEEWLGELLERLDSPAPSAGRFRAAKGS